MTALDRPCWATLDDRDPALARRIESELFESRFAFDTDVVQFGISLPWLDAAMNRFVMPALPIRAVRPRLLSYLAGRLCAEHALRLAGAGPSPLVGRGLSGEPLWPPGWTGSITHSSEFAYAAVARARCPLDIGIDVEPIIDEASCSDVERICMTPCEHELGWGDADRCEIATFVFAAKEAYFKAVYRSQQRFLDFKEIALDRLDFSGGRYVARAVSCAGGSSRLPSAPGRIVRADRCVMASVEP